jgi:hypothetical protein
MDESLTFSLREISQTSVVFLKQFDIPNALQSFLAYHFPLVSLMDTMLKGRYQPIHGCRLIAFVDSVSLQW